MYQSNQVKFQTLISFDTASFSGSYQLAGTLALPARGIVMVNGSNQAVTVSFDGTNAHAYFGASNATPQAFSFGNNKGASSDALDLPAGTPVFVKGSAGTGLFTLSYFTAYTPTMTIPQ